MPIRQIPKREGLNDTQMLWKVENKSTIWTGDISKAFRRK